MLRFNRKQQNSVKQLPFNKKLIKTNKRKVKVGVPWLGFEAFISVAWVQSLVRELRPYKLYGVAEKRSMRAKDKENVMKG